MLQIKMLKFDRGSEDGNTVADFHKGKEYNVGEWLADQFVSNNGSAVYVEEPEEVEETGEPGEEKNLGGAPENKALTGGKENKKGGK